MNVAEVKPGRGELTMLWVSYYCAILEAEGAISSCAPELTPKGLKALEAARASGFVPCREDVISLLLYLCFQCYAFLDFESVFNLIEERQGFPFPNDSGSDRAI